MFRGTARHADTNPNSLAIPNLTRFTLRSYNICAQPYRRSAVGCELRALIVLPLHCESSLGFSRCTALRQDSLSGNCKTSLVVCVSPLPANTNETVGALDFGMRAMQAWHRNAWHSACTCTRAHPQCRPRLGSWLWPI